MTDPVDPPPLKPLQPEPDADPLPRIVALTRNARTTWFALLGVLVFVGVTLMGVEHIDFYGVDRSTQLPLVGVTVPTRLFFVAAPILTAAVYGYFPLYLIRLWDALGAAQPRPDGQFLGDAVSPWLVTDAALFLRRKWRRDEPGCTPPRPLDGTSMVLNVALAWGFGIVILVWLWWISMTARSFGMTLLAAAGLLAALASGGSSLAALVLRMRGDGRNVRDLHRMRAVRLVMLVFLVAVSAVSVARTAGPARLLAQIDLSDGEIVGKPGGWLPHGFARIGFRSVWCARESIADWKDLTTHERTSFEAEWSRRRSEALAALAQPDTRINDLRDAVISGAFIAGANLAAVRMDRADLVAAYLEGAILTGVNLNAARLTSAQMNGVDLTGADLTQVDMTGASLAEAVLSGAVLTGATLDGARLAGANLTDTSARNASFDDALLDNADFFQSDLQGASFVAAKLAGADLRNANLENSDFSRSALNGALMGLTDLKNAKFNGADLSGARLYAARLHRTNLTGVRLVDAQLNDAEFDNVSLRWAALHRAQMERAVISNSDLRNAQMRQANLGYAFLAGTPEAPLDMRLADLSASRNQGGAFRDALLDEVEFDRMTDFRNAFLDGSVAVDDTFRARMGMPCQWEPQVLLDDAAYFGRWRWWFDASRDKASFEEWQLVAPPDWRDVPVNPGPEGCAWKTGPANGPR